MSSCITIWEREHAYKFTRWCDHSWGKHRQLARQVGALRVFFHRFPTPFQMVALASPIPHSTVIWFGSIEFMSTGSGYDMILLSVKGPGGAHVAPARLRAPRCPRHHASPPRKRRRQHHHRPCLITTGNSCEAGGGLRVGNTICQNRGHDGSTSRDDGRGRVSRALPHCY